MRSEWENRKSIKKKKSTFKYYELNNDLSVWKWEWGWKGRERRRKPVLRVRAEFFQRMCVWISWILKCFIRVWFSFFSLPRSIDPTSRQKPDDGITIGYDYEIRSYLNTKDSLWIRSQNPMGFHTPPPEYKAMTLYCVSAYCFYLGGLLLSSSFDQLSIKKFQKFE
jgi:hypothetical protein